MTDFLRSLLQVIGLGAAFFIAALAWAAWRGR